MMLKEKNLKHLGEKKMTIRELIQRLQGFENKDREIDFKLEQYNYDTEEYEITGEIDFIGEELEGDWVEIYLRQRPDALIQDIVGRMKGAKHEDK